MERFDWKAAAVLHGKNRKKWDAIKQLVRYKEVAGCQAEISADSLKSGELFLDPAGPAE